jgi:2-polyprenyl-3-methyl-5-hydroxy-6-metoxy-1,4-benzoquinol methylase
MRHRKWRHHHGVPDIRETADFYEAYSQRVDAMLEMLDEALLGQLIDPADTSFLDLGAAEGYVSSHLFGQGALDVDSLELNSVNIERMWLVRRYLNVKTGKVGRLDLDKVDWSKSLGRKYDVVLALGIIYHMENPVLFARNLYAATKKMAVVESDTPHFPDNERFRGHGNVYLHRDQVTLEPGNVRFLTEMRPDRQALAEILIAAGFSRVELVDAAKHHPSKYFSSGEKSMMIAIV